MRTPGIGGQFPGWPYQRQQCPTRELPWWLQIPDGDVPANRCSG